MFYHLRDFFSDQDSHPVVCPPPCLSCSAHVCCQRCLGICYCGPWALQRPWRRGNMLRHGRQQAVMFLKGRRSLHIRACCNARFHYWGATALRYGVCCCGFAGPASFWLCSFPCVCSSHLGSTCRKQMPSPSPSYFSTYRTRKLRAYDMCDSVGRRPQAARSPEGQSQF